MEDSKTTEILVEIRDLLQKNETRVSVDELTSESEPLINKVEKEGDEAALKIQSSFDRIHDKLFSVNSILIAAFVGFGKFPSQDPSLALNSVQCVA
jgi:histidinol dehydrogenase